MNNEQQQPEEKNNTVASTWEMSINDYLKVRRQYYFVFLSFDLNWDSNNTHALSATG